VLATVERNLDAAGLVETRQPADCRAWVRAGRTSTALPACA